MKFYQNKSSAIWDKESNKILCEFVNGVFETEDARTAEILISLGCEHEGEISQEPDLTSEPIQVPEREEIPKVEEETKEIIPETKIEAHKKPKK